MLKGSARGVALWSATEAPCRVRFGDDRPVGGLLANLRQETPKLSDFFRD